MKVLKNGDEINFNLEGKIYEYEVTSNSNSVVTLLCTQSYTSNIIFKELGISIRESHKIASEICGYNVCTGNFPFLKYNDYEGLTKLVIHVQKLCNIHNYNKWKQ